MEETPTKMYVIATVATVAAFVAVAFRFYARRVKGCKLWWDDYMIILAMVYLAPLLISMSAYMAQSFLPRLTLCACMSVRYSRSVVLMCGFDCLRTGTAIGDLGRHIEMEGIQPVWTRRVEVFEQVRHANISSNLPDADQ